MKQLWIAAALAVLVSGYTALAADAVVPSLGKWTLPADTTQVAGEVSVRRKSPLFTKTKDLKTVITTCWYDRIRSLSRMRRSR